jgi:hypothetical protein
MPMSLEAIRSLHLAALDVPDLQIARARSVAGQASAAVNAGSVVAFVAGIDAQDQEDVLYSIQFAQRAASGAADRYKAVGDWYKQYSRVLEMTGWVLQGFAPTSQKTAEGEYEIAKAALSIIAAAATGPQSAVLLAWRTKTGSSPFSSTTALTVLSATFRWARWRRTRAVHSRCGSGPSR